MRYISISLLLHIVLVLMISKHSHLVQEETPELKSSLTVSLTRDKADPSPQKPKENTAWTQVKKTVTALKDTVLNSATTKKDTTHDFEPVNSQAGKKAKLDYKDELYHFLKNKNHYPPMAAKLKQTGKVRVKIKVKKDGSFEDVTLVHKCDHHLLNHGTLAFLKEVSRFKPLPDHLSTEVFEVPIVYEL